MRTARFVRNGEAMDKKGTTVKQRDITVEILRIVGCLIVVGTHTKLDLYVNGQPDFSRVFIYAILADGVNVFWMILGFFCFDSKLTYAQQLKQMVRRILLPMILFSAFCFYFGGWLIRGETLLQSIMHTGEEYQYVFTEGLLKWRPAIDYTGHLWFMFTYALVMVLMPALKGIWKTVFCSNKAKGITIAFILFVFIINDCTFNQWCKFDYYGMNAVFPAICLVIIGKLFYEKKDYFYRNIGWGSLGVILFVGSNIIRTYIQYQQFLMPEKPTHLLQWYSGLGLLASVGILLTVYGFVGYIRLKTVMKKLVCHLGKLTMYVYVLHSIVVMLFYSYGINTKIQLFLGVKWYDELLYLLFFGGGVFGVAFVFAECIFFLKCLFVKMKSGRTVK